jgi:nifR3 family TIM-barrel protein
MVLKNNIFLAPMAGFTDAAFRKLSQDYGATMTFTEMVSVNALSRRNKATLKLLSFFTDENIGVQLFGQDPKTFVKAIGILEEFEKEKNFKFAAIDLNFGCPSSKIIRQGSGSALLIRPNKIKQIVEAVVSVAKRPVYCKIRSGISSKKINAVEIAKICEEAGASLVTVHARTQKQGYNGKANWSIIKKVKQEVKIPICANGDIKDFDSYLKCKKETGADCFMIGRAAVGNPFIFKELSEEKKIIPSIEMKVAAFMEYLKYAKELDINFNQIKVHAQNFTRGIPSSTKIRNALSRVKDLGELLIIIKNIKFIKT